MIQVISFVDVEDKFITTYANFIQISACQKLIKSIKCLAISKVYSYFKSKNANTFGTHCIKKQHKWEDISETTKQRLKTLVMSLVPTLDKLIYLTDYGLQDKFSY